VARREGTVDMSVEFSKVRVENHVLGCLQCLPDYINLSPQEKDVIVQLYKKKSFENAKNNPLLQPEAFPWIDKRIKELSALPEMPEESRIKCEQIAAHVFSSH
jgi:hypothetical protein